MSGRGALFEYFFRCYKLLGKEKIGNMLTGHTKLRYLRLYGTGIRLFAFKLIVLIYLVFHMISHKSAGKYDLP